MVKTVKQKESTDTVRMILRRSDRIRRLDRRAIVKMYPELKELVEIL